MESIRDMKNYIRKKYPGWWAIDRMPNRRIAAIYRSLKKYEEPPGYHQITLFEWLEEREHG